MKHKGFTLIELLVVIAVIAILSIVVVLTLNPAQLLMQSRDSSRLSDMASMNSVLGIYSAQGGTSFGTANTVYVSIPDPIATSSLGDKCQGLGLLTLPATYTYHCTASSTYRAVNGTGWIPVNLTTLAAGSPIGALPQDPTNISSSRLYYTYETNGTQYEVTSVMESQKYGVGGSNDVISNDGGVLASVYEKGSITGLEPLDYGDSSLVGYWPLNEGSGSTAYDESGKGNPGIIAGSVTLGQSGPAGRSAMLFDGSTGWIHAANTNLALNGPLTMYEWFNTNTLSLPNNHRMMLSDDSVASYMSIEINGSGIGFTSLFLGAQQLDSSGFSIQAGSWYSQAVTWDGTNLRIYENGVLKATSGPFSGAPTLGSGGTGIDIGTFAGQQGTAWSWSGLLSGVRIYNRALSAGQIAAMYNGGK